MWWQKFGASQETLRCSKISQTNLQMHIPFTICMTCYRQMLTIESLKLFFWRKKKHSKNGTQCCSSWLWMEVGAKVLAQGQLLWCAIKNHGDHDKYYHLQKQLHSEREESAWVVISVIVGKMIPPDPIPSNSPGTARAKLKMGCFLEQ